MDKPLNKYAIIEAKVYEAIPTSYNLKRTFPGLIAATKYKESLETVAQLENEKGKTFFLFELSPANKPKVDLG
jgi:hypothetical protein